MKQNRLAVLALAAIALGACGKKPQPEVPAPQPPVEQKATPAVDPDAERRAREAEEARRKAEEAARARAALSELIYFDYDQFSIRADARATLEAKVPFLRADESIRMRIDGHADERGSDEYNLALGLRRANAVKDFLVGYGLDAGRFEVRSFGEQQPLDMRSTEEAYAKNRRAEFQITAGSILNH